MWYEVLKTSSVQKLKSLLQNRYGKGLYVQFITEANSEDENSGVYDSDAGTLRIPISVNNHYLATALVPRAESLTSEQHHVISEMVKLVLEPVCYSHFFIPTHAK